MNPDHVSKHQAPPTAGASKFKIRFGVSISVLAILAFAALVVDTLNWHHLPQTYLTPVMAGLVLTIIAGFIYAAVISVRSAEE